MRIGVDLMGSDNSPLVLFDAVVQAINQLDQSVVYVVIATAETVDELKSKVWQILPVSQQKRIEFRVVSESIAMHEEPLHAIRHKKGSSLSTGIRLVKKRKIDALVTAGNTGAIIAAATISLPRLPGIKRPALLAVLPTQKGSVAVIDIGGNVSCKAQHLIQFAQMGAAYQRCSQGLQCPVVGLLNIGVESKKGNPELQQAYQSLKEHAQEVSSQGQTPSMCFYGNIEGREVFRGNIDVLVTDGFTGNVLLKTSEGVAAFILDFLARPNPNVSSDVIKTSMDALRHHFCYTEYPGAIVCGVDGIVVKCHGNSTSKGMFCGIKGTIGLVQKQLISKFKEQLQ